MTHKVDVVEKDLKGRVVAEVEGVSDVAEEVAVQQGDKHLLRAARGHGFFADGGALACGLHHRLVGILHGLTHVGSGVANVLHRGNQEWQQ